VEEASVLLLLLLLVVRTVAFERVLVLRERRGFGFGESSVFGGEVVVALDKVRVLDVGRIFEGGGMVWLGLALLVLWMGGLMSALLTLGLALLAIGLVIGTSSPALVLGLRSLFAGLLIIAVPGLLICAAVVVTASRAGTRVVLTGDTFCTFFVRAYRPDRSRDLLSAANIRVVAVV
jgi:hypothetical protein